MLTLTVEISKNHLWGDIKYTNFEISKILNDVVRILC